MAQNRPDKPSITLPDDFGGTQTAFSSSLIESGYEASIPQIVEGANLNYMLNGLFQNTKYMRTVLDYVRDTPIGKMFWVNTSGQMDYVEPAIIATDTEFSTGIATDKTPNVKQVVDNLALKSNDNDVVHLAGTETITGEKTFATGTSNSWINIKTNSIDYTQTPTTENVYAGVNFKDKDGNQVATVYTAYYTSGEGLTGLSLKNHSGTIQTLALRCRDNGSFYTAAPASDINNSIVTTVNKSKASNGYFKLGNGLIVQWGRVTGITTNKESTVTFPVAFTSSTSYTIVKNYQSNAAYEAADREVSFYSMTSTTAKTFTASSDTNSFSWLAIGY